MALRYGAVLLAAGESRRLQVANKLLLPFGEQSLLRRSAQVLVDAGFAQIVVVVGHEADRIVRELVGLDVEVVVNRAYRDGQMVSVDAGLRALDDGLDAVFICLADQPALTAEDLRELQGAFADRPRGSILVPYHRGKRGNPAVLDAAHVPQILALGPQPGCRGFIDQDRDRVHTYPFPNDHVIRDVDVRDDYDREAGLDREGGE